MGKLAMSDPAAAERMFVSAAPTTDDAAVVERADAAAGSADAAAGAADETVGTVEETTGASSNCEAARGTATSMPCGSSRVTAPVVASNNVAV